MQKEKKSLFLCIEWRKGKRKTCESIVNQNEIDQNVMPYGSEHLQFTFNNLYISFTSLVYFFPYKCFISIPKMMFVEIILCKFTTFSMILFASFFRMFLHWNGICFTTEESSLIYINIDSNCLNYNVWNWLLLSTLWSCSASSNGNLELQIYLFIL